MTVLLIGDASYREFELLTGAVEERGHHAKMIDVQEWPGDTPLTYDVGADTARIIDDVDLSQVEGVFPYTTHMFRILQTRFKKETNESGLIRTSLKLGSWRGILNSILSICENRGATVFFPPRTQHYHDHKPLQMAQLSEVGVPTPETIFTNDQQRVRAFVKRHGEVVFKPVAGSAPPKRLSQAALSDVNLAKISNAPVQLQRFIPGDDVRVYFLDGEVVDASKYITDAWTFKHAETDGAEQIEPSEDIIAAVEQAAARSPLKFGAADVRISDEEFTVLELNPNPRFAFHDVHGSTDIAGTLAEALIG